MCSVSGVLNPASLLRNEIGGVGGAIFDPIGAVAKETGGVFGHFLDPAQATENLVKGKGDIFGAPKPAEQKAAEAVKTREQLQADHERRLKALQSQESKSKSLLFGDGVPDSITNAPNATFGTNSLESMTALGSKTLLGT